jgi:hypothetical protein
MRHLIPCTTKITAEELGDLFIESVWGLHGLPNTIISNRGGVLASKFWTQVCKRLGRDPRLSTAFHPDTDCQTERCNAVFETYLRAYVNHLQNDWKKWLPLAEFVENNYTSESTGISLFFVNARQDRKLLCNLNQPTPTPEALDAERQVSQLQEIHEVARLNMLWAQDRYEENADLHTARACVSDGDKVWLSTSNISTTQTSRKLDWKQIGPYHMLRRVGPHAYELDL